MAVSPAIFVGGQLVVSFIESKIYFVVTLGCDGRIKGMLLFILFEVKVSIPFVYFKIKGPVESMVLKVSEENVPPTQIVFPVSVPVNWGQQSNTTICLQ